MPIVKLQCWWRRRHRIGADSRRGRCDAQSNLCRCLQPGSGFLRVLSFDAGLRARPEKQRHADAAHARLKLFPLFHRSLWQVAGKSGAGRAGPLEHGPEAMGRAARARPRATSHSVLLRPRVQYGSKDAPIGVSYLVWIEELPASVRIRGKSGHQNLRSSCPLMTHNGHCIPIQAFQNFFECQNALIQLKLPNVNGG